MKNDQPGDDSSNDGPEPTAPPIAVAVPIDPHNCNINMTNTPSLSAVQTDEEAQALAVAAREHGIAVIRHHCQQHMSQNPGSSYVTWIATLHPENAQVAIDPRFLTAENPWLAAYDETYKEFQTGRIQHVATATAYPDATAPSQHHDEGNGEKKDEVGQRRRYTGFLDLIIGHALVLASVMVTIAIEIISAFAYLGFWQCDKIVNYCYPPGLFSWLPLLVAFAVGRSFQLIDMMLLFVSILVVEGIAAANCIICTILGCSLEGGQSMHQMTRKTPHIIRWAFRRHFDSWDPKRAYWTPRAAATNADSLANRPANS